MNENYGYRGGISEGGLTHIHTEMSKDANLSLDEVGEYMRGHLRSEYFVVNDHLTTPYRENSYPESEIQATIEDMLNKVAEYNESNDRPKCVSGVEANIITGGVDIPDSLLAKIDFVVASRHFPWGNEDDSQIVHNLTSAMQNPNVDTIGHISGYAGESIDWDLVFQTAETTHTCIEINFDKPPTPEMLKIMSKYEIMYTIGVDFHTFQGLKGRMPVNSDLTIDFAEAKKIAKSQEETSATIKQEYTEEPIGFDVLKRLINLMRTLEDNGISTDNIVNTHNLESFLTLLRTPKNQRRL